MSTDFARARRRAFWRGFRDGISGGPLWRFLDRLTLLGLLNFLVLQWVGVRLARVMEVLDVEWTEDDRRSYERQVGWELMFWVVPLTGWWSDYRRLTLRGD